MFKSLKTTLLFSHLGVIILTNLVVGSILYSFMITSLEHEQRIHLEFSSEHAASIINAELQHKSDLLGRIANGQEVLKFSENYRELALAAYFAKFQQEFSSVSFINQSGQEELKVQGIEISDEPLQDHSTSSFFKEAMSHPNSVVFAASKDTAYNDQAVLLMAIAKFNYFGDTFAGLILATLPYEKIAQAITGISLITDAYYILDDGHTFTTLVYPLSAEKDQIVIQKNSKITHTHEKQPNAHAVFFDRTEMFDSDVLATHFHDPAIRWTITSVIPHSVLLHETHRIRNIVLIIFTSMLAMSAVAVYLLACGITSPLYKLTRAAKAITRGKMNQIVDIKSQDEVGRMVQTFNYMIRSLKDTTVSRDYFDTVINSMVESLIVLNSEGKIATVNSATCTMLGYLPDELIDQPITAILQLDTIPADFKFFEGELHQFIRDCELFYRTKNEQQIPVLFSASPMANHDGEKTGIVCLAIDITKRKKMEEALKQNETKFQTLAITDELTSLLNRRGFMAMAMQQLQGAKRRDKNTYLMFADLDNLKWINDNLGHQTGDQVIKEAGLILKDTFRDSDIVGRLGGDEFAVLFADAEDEKNIAARLEENIALSNENVNRSYNLSLSFGIVLCDFKKGCALDSLMTEADALMYQCKQKKKGKISCHPALIS